MVFNRGAFCMAFGHWSWSLSPNSLVLIVCRWSAEPWILRTSTNSEARISGTYQPTCGTSVTNSSQSLLSESCLKALTIIKLLILPEKSFLSPTVYTASVRNTIVFVTSLHFAWVVDDAICIVVTRVCVSVCLSAAPCLHYCTDPDVTLGVAGDVHYWADLQSVHGLRCYGNITQTRNVSEYMLVLAVCLVGRPFVF